MNIGARSYYRIHNVNSRMLLDPSVPDGGGDTNYPIVLLARILIEKGHRVGIFDRRNINDYDKIIFFEFPEFRRTGMPNKYLRKLIKDRFEEMYLVCVEPEVVKPNNWIIDNHKYFKKIFTWHGDYIDNKIYFRINSTSHKKGEKVDFELTSKAKLCTFIARNKFSRHPKELYSERRKAIRWFEKNHPEDFDLYGVGWDRYLSTGIYRPANLIDGGLRRLGNVLSRYYGKENIFHRSAQFSKWSYSLLHDRRVEYPSYRGPAVSTKEVLMKYKFAICFENSSFPGWITERIFDCFLSGCVPIYLGDPNITNHIPTDTFIDVRQFERYEDIYDHIKNMTDNEYLEHINAIKNFVNSDESYPFTAEYFAKTLINEILND